MEIVCKNCGIRQSELWTNKKYAFILVLIGYRKHAFYCRECIKTIPYMPNSANNTKQEIMQ